MTDAWAEHAAVGFEGLEARPRKTQAHTQAPDDGIVGAVRVLFGARVVERRIRHDRATNHRALREGKFRKG